MGEIQTGGDVPNGDMPRRGDPKPFLEKKPKFFEAFHNQLLVGNASGNPLYPDISSFVGDVITEFGSLTRIAAGDAAQDPRVTRTRDCLQLLIKASDIRAYGIPPNGKDLAIKIRRGQQSALEKTAGEDHLLVIRPDGINVINLAQFRNYEHVVEKQSGELLPFSAEYNRTPEMIGEDLIIFDGQNLFTRINQQGDIVSSGWVPGHMTVAAVEELRSNPIQKRVDEPWEVEAMGRLYMEPTIKGKLMTLVDRNYASGKAYSLESFMERDEIFKKGITTLCQRFDVQVVTDIPPLEAYGRKFALTGKIFGFGSTSFVLEAEDVATNEKVAVKFGMMFQALRDDTEPVDPARELVQEEIDNYRKAQEVHNRLLTHPSQYQKESYSAILNGNGPIGNADAAVPYVIMESVNPRNNASDIVMDLSDIIRSDKISLPDKKVAHRMLVYLEGNFLDGSARTYGYMQGDAQFKDLVINPSKRCAQLIDLNVARGDTPYENWIQWCEDLTSTLVSSSPSFSKEEKGVLKSVGLHLKVDEVKEMLIAHRERMAKEGEINDALLDTLLIDLMTFNREEKTSKYPPTADGMIQVADVLDAISTFDIAKPGVS